MARLLAKGACLGLGQIHPDADLEDREGEQLRSQGPFLFQSLSHETFRGRVMILGDGPRRAAGGRLTVYRKLPGSLEAEG